MGYGLPAALGAHAATGRPVVCLEGEGSLMMNLQELQTLATQGYPIKLFVLDNGGYVSILQTQTNHFAGRLIGTGPTSGVGFPNLPTLASAFQLPFAAIECEADLDRLPELLAGTGPLLCRVSLPHDYALAPKLASHRLANGTMVSRPLEDMAPFLSREELAENMLVPLLPDE
jgi:acetolactate synthase-1/2/3 large subunit